MRFQILHTELDSVCAYTTQLSNSMILHHFLGVLSAVHVGDCNGDILLQQIGCMEFIASFHMM